MYYVTALKWKEKQKNPNNTYFFYEITTIYRLILPHHCEPQSHSHV